MQDPEDMTDLTQFVNEKLAIAIYEEPARAFGGTWRQSSAAQRCREHLLLADKHPARDGGYGGAFILDNLPYIIYDGGDTSIRSEIVKYYQQLKGIDNYIKAVKELAALYNVPYDVPGNWKPSAEYIQTHKNREEDIDDAVAMALFTPDDSREAEYLRARGITDNLRHDNHIFAVNEQTEPILNRIRKRHRDTSSAFPKGINARGSHTIGTPIYEHGHIVAFYFRTLSPDITPKYLAWHIEKDSPIMFGLHRASPTARRSLVLVEGVFDVIMAQEAIGKAYDVAGYLSSSLKDRQAALIAQAGYRNVIQIVDYDGAEKTSRTIQYVKSTEKTLAAEGLTALVVDLIDEAHPDVKQDANSFIQQFGADAFTARVKEAQHGTRYIINGIARAAEHGTDEELSNARRDIKEALSIEPSADVVNDILARDGSPTARLFGDIDSLRTQLTEERKRLVEKAAEEERRRAIADKCAEVTEHARKGEYEEAKKCADEARRLIDGDGGTAWNAVKGGRAIAPIIDRFKRKAEGLFTRWNVSPDGTDAERKPIIIPPAAITTISARTGHGKTKALINIALMFMERAKVTGRPVVYIPYEEDICDTLVNFINVDSNIPMQLSIDGRTEYDNKTLITTCIREDIGLSEPATESKKRIFTAVEEGKLIVIDEEPTVEDIARLVVGSDGDIEAICIDYLQLIRTENKKATDPKNILVNVMQTLNHVARSTGVSVIAASQFNRECNAPTDMTESKNAAAADIEWATALNIGIYSSYRHPNSITWNDDSDEVKRIKTAGFNPDDIYNHSIYMKVLKGRQRGQTEHWGVMSFDGNTGRIGSNVR